jgi:hypothetical protein
LKPSGINCCCAEHLRTSLYSPSPCSATTVTTSPYGPNKQQLQGDTGTNKAADLKPPSLPCTPPHCLWTAANCLKPATS